MESPKYFYKIDTKLLQLKWKSKIIYFTKPRLIAYYKQIDDTVEPANKILYFKKPKSQTYPIDLNPSDNCHQLRSNLKADLECELKYAMTPSFNKSLPNEKKLKIFAERKTLVKLMCYRYRKDKIQCTIRVCRYNGDLYMVSRNKEIHTVLELNKLKHQATRLLQFKQHVFTESFCHEPKPNGPCYPNDVLIGVNQSSLGEFELIYSGCVDGIKTEDDINVCNDMDVLNACHWVMTDTRWNCEKNDPQGFLCLKVEAYLAHALDLYIAFYSDELKIEKPIVHKRLSKLPMKNKSHCTAFLYKFLQEVNQLMSRDNVNSFDTVYEFYVDTEKHSVTYEYKIYKDRPEKVILTPEYMEYCRKESSNSKFE